jgi:transposase
VRPDRSVPPAGHPKVTPVKYVGIDVHKKMCQAAILDDDGALLDEQRFPNTAEGIEEYAGKLASFNDDLRAVVESTGNLWIQIHDRLETRGFDVALSNPGKTRLIAEAKVKTDKVDARTLAALLRADMIPTCYVPDEELRSRRELLRHRLNLVKTRTTVKNRIHGLLDKHGLRMPETASFSRGNIDWLRGLSLGFMDDAILRSDLVLLEAVGEQVEVIEEKIAVIAAEEQQARLLMTMTGVGYFTAMLILSEVGDIGRFRSDKAFASWMGLTPSVHQSGERTRIGGVGPGNKRLRWAMVECAQAAVRFDPRFRGLHERVSRRRGAGCATVAVAHEMARIMYFMLCRNEPYRGADGGLVERKLKNMSRKAMDGLRN